METDVSFPGAKPISEVLETVVPISPQETGAKHGDSEKSPVPASVVIRPFLGQMDWPSLSHNPTSRY